jgi:TATA-binding protein-associated factor Taf7
MSKGDPSKPQVIQIQPVLEKSESLVDSIDSRTETKTQQIKETYTQRFEIDIPFLQYKGLGNLVELPTVTESYKTKDQINLFKSNDIN